jgi:methionine synthase II (cobalamin-independent)
MLIDEEAGKPVNNRALESHIGLRVSHVLEKQAAAGIDIINDGEQGRVGFQTYVTQRMSGFGGVSKRPYGKEFIEYPQFTKRMMERLGKISKVFDAPEATADIKYRDTARSGHSLGWSMPSRRQMPSLGIDSEDRDTASVNHAVTDIEQPRRGRQMNLRAGSALTMARGQSRGRLHGRESAVYAVDPIRGDAAPCSFEK